MKIDWYSIFIQQSSSVMTFWNVYIAVVIGLLGFVIQKGSSITPKDKAVFMVAFALFALSNLYPMYDAQSSLVQIYANLPSGSVFSEPHTCPLVIVHILFDIIILMFLYSRQTKST
jgi:hypothetical protein